MLTLAKLTRRMRRETLTRGPVRYKELRMICKSMTIGLAAAFLFSVLLSPIAEARGHRGGHHRCAMHSHLDYGTNHCVKNRKH